MARIHVDKAYHEFYRVLANDAGDQRTKTFDTMKDVFMLAFGLGVSTSQKTALETSQEVFSDSVLRDLDRDLIKAVALADEVGIEALADDETLIKIAEEYANTGIRILKREYLSATPAESMARALLDAVPAQR